METEAEADNVTESNTEENDDQATKDLLMTILKWAAIVALGIVLIHKIASKF